LEQRRNFTTRQIDVGIGGMAYMFTDGYADQFGGERGKKFMVKRFHELLSEIHLLSPDEQKEALRQNFEDWRQNHEQVDDVLIVGIEI
jgi:serine phosphatase RsbU (regulator of sigma subunit)